MSIAKLLDDITQRGAAVVLERVRDDQGGERDALRITGLKLLSQQDTDDLRQSKDDVIAFLRARQVPVMERTFRQCCDAEEGPEVAVTVLGCRICLIFDFDRYMAARPLGSGEPIPLSPKEYEMLADLVAAGEVEEELARQGRGDVCSSGPRAGRLQGEGAAARARQQVALTLLLKAELGGRVVAAGRGAHEAVVAQMPPLNLDGPGGLWDRARQEREAELNRKFGPRWRKWRGAGEAAR